MSTGEVVFKANGEWSFGQPISEMDVKAERSAGAPANSPAPGTTPTPAGEGTPAKKTRKKLDMNKLKKSAGKAAKPADPKEVASAEEKTAPKKTKKETKPAPASEPEPVPVREPTPEPIPEPEPAPVPVPEPESIPEPEPEPAPSAPVEDPKKEQEFKLKQMGLSDRPESAEDVKPTQEPVIVSEPPKSAPAPEPPKPAPAPAPKPTPEPVKDNGPDPDFIFHNLEEFCEVSGATTGTLSKFARAVVRAAASKTAIWESKDMPTLRVYSCTPVSGRGVPAGVRCLLAVGYDIHMTCCYVSDSFAVTDGSSNLKCVGTCAYVRDTPVALSMERKREAVTV